MSFFETDKPVFYAESPGRMDVMGGIADYSGSLLLQIPVKQTTSVSIQKRDDDKIVLRSAIGKNEIKEFSIETSRIKNKDLEETGNIIRSQPGDDWAAYVLGCFTVLENLKGLQFDGISVSISSNIPLGKGVSSSAALEVATMNAISKAYNLHLDPQELAILAQKAENFIVGAPCGLMDQLSVELGERKKLLPLICQPCTVMKPVRIPRGIEFCGIDSGIRHAVSGASYSDVRAAAFMGYSIIAKEKGAEIEDLYRARESSDWSQLPYQGYLANISKEEFNQRFKTILPESITGKEFTDKYGLTIDKVTSVDPVKRYNIQTCARHPVYENARVNSFLNILKRFSRSDEKEKLAEELGQLMLQSHESYTSVGLGNNFTDEIVEDVKNAGPGSGVYGARVTGGGSGGTVVVLCYGKEGKQKAKEIFKTYKKRHRKKIFFFQGSSHGAAKLNQEGK